MKRFISKLRYFCADAWEEWRHSLGVNLMALGTLVSALFVAGLVMLVLFNVDHRVQGLRDEIRVQIYLADDHDGGHDALQVELEAMDRVERVVYVDKQAALERYREWAADMAALADEFDSNPLPASLEVYFEPGRGATETAGRIASTFQGRDEVDEVRFDEAWLERLESMVDVARIGGIALAALILVAVIFVMASVLRLAVLARHDEIAIMQLVGATPGFIRGPYLVAGVAQGALAAVVALVIVEAARRTTVAASSASGSSGLVELLASQALPATLLGLLVLTGVVVSTAGSFFAVRQP